MHRPWLSALIAVGALLLPTAACAETPGSEMPATPTDPAMWLVADEDTTIYMLGTFHLLPGDIDWFNGDIRAAFEEADELVVEVLPPADGGGALIRRLAAAEDGTSLSDKLGAADAARLEAALGRIGTPLAAFEGVDPWFAMLTVTVAEFQRLGFDPDAGVEQVLMGAAERSAKPMEDLETLEQQLNFFETMPMERQTDMLRMALDDLEDMPTAIGEMVEDWREGDVENLAASLNDGFGDEPELRRLLLTDRNRAWADWIDERLDEPGTVFLAVGVAHLAGDDSVQRFLAERGIATRRLD